MCSPLSHHVRKWSLIIALVGQTGCDIGDSLERISGPTMGSTYTVQYVRRRASGENSPEQVRVQVEAILAEIDRTFSTYRGDSDTERFNELPANSCQPMPPPLLKLVRYGEQLSQQSDGAYDLTVEPLVNLWGFGPQAREEKVPQAQALASARQKVGYQHLRIEGEQLCKDAAVELDFNSIAPGYAVDRIAERLQELGINSFLADVTSEIKVVGRKPDGTPWRVALEVPRDDRQEAQQVLSFDGYGISTSGDYRNYFEENGRRYSHTFDARTGRPIEHDLTAVTVIAPSVMIANGLSTMLLALGPQQGWDYALQHKIAAFFVIRADKAFVSRSTPAFEPFVAGDKGR